jgi:cytochrome c oxidase subunit 2
MFSGPSNFVESVDLAFWVVMVISVFFLVVITFMMVYFVIKYDKKRNPKAKNIHGNITLEVTWTVIPTILTLVMFWYGWVGYKYMSDVPEDAMPIEVTAQMWKWSFKYQNGVQSDTLYVPLNKDVRLNLNSLDVNHSFFIPAFRVKKDVIPNKKNYVWFNASEPGSYDIACTEYCGLNHWNMYTKVVVIPEQNFNFWLDNMANRDATQQTNNSVQSDTTSQRTNTTTQTDTVSN